MMTIVEKTTANERRALKRREMIAKGKADAGIIKGGINEPTIQVLKYKVSLIQALNYYNAAYDNKEKRKWVENFGDSNKLDKLPDYEFRTLGALVRLKKRGQYIEDNELAFIQDELNRLYTLNSTIQLNSLEPNKQAKSIVPIKNKLEDAANACAAEFDGMLDDYRSNGTTPDFAGCLKSNNISKQALKLIPEFYTQNISDIKEVFSGTNEQLVENYSYMSRVKLRKYLNVLESIKTACEEHISITKVPTIRKPRVKKEKPASIIVKSMNYLIESPELGIKSEPSIKLVGASEVLLYNVRYHKLTILRVPEGNSLSVKGSTIIGFDETLSSSKTLRKNVDVKSFITMNKRSIASTFKDLKSKEQVPTGRVNKDTLILKVL